MSLRQFSYTGELEKAAQGSRWNDCLSQVRSEQPEIIDSLNIVVNPFTLHHSHASLLEFDHTLYYFFLSDSTEQGKPKEFSCTISSFLKSQGENHKLDIHGLKGTPSTLATALMNVTDPNGKPEDEKHVVVALIGLEEGFIKVLEVVEGRSGGKALVKSHKVEQKPVVQIVAAQERHYNRKNICFLLLEDSKVFLYNYLSKQVVAILQPPVLSHDFAISLTLHDNGINLATASKSGQIFFWELGKPVLDAIEKSEKRVQKKPGAEEVEWAFTAKDRALNVFPMTALHSASIYGLKWISFYGDLLALVSRTGLFRLIAVNFPLRDEYLNLIEYQIEDGEAISSVQIFPSLEVLVVTKCREYTALLSEEEIRARAGGSGGKKKEAALKPEYNARMNSNCYTTKSIPECVLEKIKFGSDLRVEHVERTRPQSHKKEKADFTYSIVSERCNFLLVGDNKRYWIGPCETFFGVDR